MFGNILNYILGLGAAIFLPIIMIIIGLIIKMKFKRAIVSGLTLGVAFTGMNVVLGFMFDTISPVASAFVEKTGIQLNIIDVGWSPMSAIAWAWPYALFMFPLQIGINLLMLVFKQTNILNVDLWNVWGKIFTATMVAAITGNIALGFIAAAVQVIVELKIGEDIFLRNDMIPIKNRRSYSKENSRNNWNTRSYLYSLYDIAMCNNGACKQIIRLYSFI